MNIFIELIKKRLEIRQIYKNGIGKPYYLLRFWLPIISCIIFLLIMSILNLKESNTIELIKQFNSLIGIILGFSIASFAIFISINNDKLESKSKISEYTYREIGSSLFFYNVERSLFISLLGILMLYINLPEINIINFIKILYIDINGVSFNYTKIIKILIFILYIFMFLQLIFNLFYSSIFLNSSIKK